MPDVTPTDLRVFRARHRLSQRELAEALDDISSQTVQAWERGVAKPPPYFWRALRDLEREMAAGADEPAAARE